MLDKNSIPCGSSFEFYSDYVNKEKALQPEYYDEVEKILNTAIAEFTKNNGRAPIVLDIGSAGIIPYNADLVDSAIIIDLFNKPQEVELPNKILWIVGNFLDITTVNKILAEYHVDIIVVSSVLHHLCDDNNNSLKNLALFLSNIKRFTTSETYIFESVCPQILANLQDFIWPIQTFILSKIIKFANVRMMSEKEIYCAVSKNNLSAVQIPFKQPKYIAQFFFRVPTKIYPLKIVAIKIYDEREEGNNRA